MAGAEVEQKGESVKRSTPTFARARTHAQDLGLGVTFLMPAPEAFCTSWQDDISFKVTAGYIKTA